MTSKGLIKIQDSGGEVFVHYLPLPAGQQNGGSIWRVFPGERFHGLDFDLLKGLGTGEHEIDIDERALSSIYKEPKYDSDRQRDCANLRYKLFMYFNGAMTRNELVGGAFEYTGLYSVEDLLAEWPSDLQQDLVDDCISPPGERKDWTIVTGGCVVLDTPEKKAAYEGKHRELVDRSYLGYCRLHEHFHKLCNG